jgi:hypothetical protein
MKTLVEFKDLTKDVLVDFFSTVTYGSPYFYIRCKYENVLDLDDCSCREEAWAKALFEGLKIEVVDVQSEGELYSDKGYIEKDGDCPDDEGVGVYPLKLEDFRDGFERCINGDFKDDGMTDHWVRRAAMDCFNDSGNVDLADASVVMQVICFNEVIYC